VRGLREQITKPRKRALKILFGLIGTVIVGGLIIAAIEDYEASAGFEIGKSYSPLPGNRVCSTTADLDLWESEEGLSGDELLDLKESDNARRAAAGLPHSRGPDCTDLGTDSDLVVILEKDGERVKVRLVNNPALGGQSVPFPFPEGWMEAKYIKPGNVP
jgi:hypothetical protein